MDIQCVFIDPVTKGVSLRLGSKIVTGPSKLFQIVVLSLLNVPGKDVLDPSLGGGMPEIVGLNFDATDRTEVFAEVARRVKKTQTEILQAQIGSNAPASERLRELHIIDIVVGATADAADLKLRIVNELGQTQDLVL